MSEAQVLVEVTRGPLVENRHRGHVAVVDLKGRLLYSAGDPHHRTYWRSSAKPVQALPVLESGAAEHYRFTDRELALFCASHSGEAVHTDTVQGVLEKIGLDQAALQCGTHLPFHRETAEQMMAAGAKPNVLHSNCSGKHSGLLALARYKGYDINSYMEPNSPLQQELLDYISSFTEYPREDILIGTDGCGVPVYGLPLYNMALAFARMVRPVNMPEAKAAACRRLTRAMHTFPEMVGGTGRLCSDLMRVGRGKLIAKAGAAGVYCVGIFEPGIGIALKGECGLAKPRNAAVVEVLRRLNFIDAASLEALASYHLPTNKNHRGEVCGEYLPVVKLQKCF